MCYEFFLAFCRCLGLISKVASFKPPSVTCLWSFLLDIIFKFSAGLAGCHTPIPLPEMWGLVMPTPWHTEQHLAARAESSVC